MGEKWPNGSTRRDRNIVGICIGITLPKPYRTIVAPSANRMSSRNRLYASGWLSRRLISVHTAVVISAISDSVPA
jgi:hypothetical protein